MLDLYIGRRGGAVLSWGVGRSPPRPTVSVLVLDRNDVRAGQEPPTAHQTTTSLQRLPNTVTRTHRRRQMRAFGLRLRCSPKLVDEVGYAPPLLGLGEVAIEQSAHPVNDTAEFHARGLHTLGVAEPECPLAFAEPLGSVRVALTGDGLTNLNDFG